MSSSQDPEIKRAAVEKAREGARLFEAGDYEGAIAACTEAIELEPRIQGAYRTRAEASRRLRMPLPNPRERTTATDDSFNERPKGWSPSFGESSLPGIFFSLWIIVVGVIVALVSGSGWALLLFGGWGLLTLLWSLWDGINASQDQSSDVVKLHGKVTRARSKEYTHEQGSDYTHHVTVSGSEFTVSEELSNWVRQGDEVDLTYYPHSKKVTEVTRTNRTKQGFSAQHQRPMTQIISQHTLLMDELYRALETIGVDSDIDAYSDLIEISGGPICSIEMGQDQYDPIFYITCFVPEPRGVLPMTAFRSVRVRWAPVFGPVKEVRWPVSPVSLSNEDTLSRLGIYDDQFDQYDLPKNRSYGSNVADRLKRDEAVTTAIKAAGIDLQIFSKVDGWMLHYDEGHDSLEMWTNPSTLKPIWRC